MGPGANPWHPGVIDPRISFSAHMVLLLAMLVRGADYATGDTASTARRLGAVESAAPLWIWGGLLIGAALIGFFGVLINSTQAIIISHSVGAALYTAIGCGIVWDTWVRSEAVHLQHAMLPALLGGIALVAVITAVSTRRGESTRFAVWTVTACLLAIVTVPLDGLRNATVLFAIAGMHGIMAAATAMDAARKDELRKRRANDGT